MSQSLVKNTIHAVFSTKGRHPWLSPNVQPRVFAYLAGIFQEWNCPAIVIGGHDDHVHALFALNKNHRAEEDRRRGQERVVEMDQNARRRAY